MKSKLFLKIQPNRIHFEVDGFQTSLISVYKSFQNQTILMMQRSLLKFFRF